MASQFIYWLADGAGADVGNGRIASLYHWILGRGNANLIVYGGDVYNQGKPSEYSLFAGQFGNDFALVCEPPGNHDWMTTSASTATGTIPSSYEEFWKARTSRQPIDQTKKGGARYEHAHDVNGWRLVFLDTGPCGGQPWPMGDATRRTWLDSQLSTPGRAKIVFAHHSRISCGKHGDNPNVDEAWRLLFDATGKPRVALTVGGHDHAVHLYSPRSREDLKNETKSFADGIYVLVNGAGGRGADSSIKGKPGNLFNFPDSAPQYAVTEIELSGTNTAKVRIWGFGNTPSPNVAPVMVKELAIVV